MATVKEDERIALIADLFRRVLAGEAAVTSIRQGGTSPVTFAIDINVPRELVLAGQTGQEAYEIAEQIAVFWMQKAELLRPR